jgi:peroxiredoxin
MVSTLHYIRQERAWQKKYDARAPKVGEQAPDFELADTCGEQLVRLSDFRGHKPVVLIFGSFT